MNSGGINPAIYFVEKNKKFVAYNENLIEHRFSNIERNQLRHFEVTQR